MPGEPTVREMRVFVTATDSAETVRLLADNGATILAGATLTPWQTRNARLEGPAGLQLTLFSDASTAPRA